MSPAIGCLGSAPRRGSSGTAFDKWQVIPVVDDAYTVVDLIRTYF